MVRDSIKTGMGTADDTEGVEEQTCGWHIGNKLPLTQWVKASEGTA